MYDGAPRSPETCSTNPTSISSVTAKFHPMRGKRDWRSRCSSLKQNTRSTFVAALGRRLAMSARERRSSSHLSPARVGSLRRRLGLGHCGVVSGCRCCSPAEATARCDRANGRSADQYQFAVHAAASEGVVCGPRVSQWDPPGDDRRNLSVGEQVEHPPHAARAVNSRLLLGGVVQLDEKSGRLLHSSRSETAGRRALRRGVRARLSPVSAAPATGHSESVASARNVTNPVGRGSA